MSVRFRGKSSAAEVLWWLEKKEKWTVWRYCQNTVIGTLIVLYCVVLFSNRDRFFFVKSKLMSLYIVCVIVSVVPSIFLSACVSQCTLYYRLDLSLQLASSTFNRCGFFRCILTLWKGSQFIVSCERLAVRPPFKNQRKERKTQPLLDSNFLSFLLPYWPG